MSQLSFHEFYFFFHRRQSLSTRKFKLGSFFKQSFQLKINSTNIDSNWGIAKRVLQIRLPFSFVFSRPVLIYYFILTLVQLLSSACLLPCQAHIIPQQLSTIQSSTILWCFQAVMALDPKVQWIPLRFWFVPYICTEMAEQFWCPGVMKLECCYFRACRAVLENCFCPRAFRCLQEVIVLSSGLSLQWRWGGVFPESSSSVWNGV